MRILLLTIIKGIVVRKSRILHMHRIQLSDQSSKLIYLFKIQTIEDLHHFTDSAKEVKVKSGDITVAER